MNEFVQKFIDDATDLLSELEQNILELEKDYNNSRLIEEVFRAMHTLKGTAAMYGFEEIGKITHRLETIFDSFRNGRLQVSSEKTELTFQAIDLMRNMLQAPESTDYKEAAAELIKKIGIVLTQAGLANIFENQNEINILAQAKGYHTWLIIIKPTSDLRQRGVKMHRIFDELTEIGQNIILTRNWNKEQGADVFWEIFLATESPKNDIEDILIFIQDITIIEHIIEGNLFDKDWFIEELKKISELQVTDIKALKEHIEIHKNTTHKENTFNAVLDSKKVESIKVSADKLDEQMILLSELVTAKAEMQLIVERQGYKDLARIVENFEKITRRFRRNIFNIRLVPLETLQIRFDRLIRDLSEQLGKHVNFITEGMNTELDKTIIDQLEKPLMHLIRNCLDHGIEDAETRKQKNKPHYGKITLAAKQIAGNVLITVSDDGDGINTTRIREKAIEKGLITENETLSDSELFEFIFTPGFSTARNLTEVSGRGVGMDVVRQSIISLRGSIDVESHTGTGTIFTIKLPLTLSIIDTMLVKSNGSFYAIPLSIIERCTEIYNYELNESDNNQIIINDILYAYFDLKNIFKYKYLKEINDEEEKTIKQKAIIVKTDNEKVAIIVDEVIGEHQAVLKPIGDFFKHQAYISGASQLADGQIAIVLDPERFLGKKNL